MGKVTGAWERPIQGVSQQADKDRIDGQCTLQENLIPSPLYGLIKRTGTRNVGLLEAAISEDSLWYSYSRGDDESYFIVIEPNSTPRVFDITGQERTVNVQSGSEDYYKVDNPKETLRLSTIADYSFLLNTEKVVKVTDELTPENPKVAIVYCQFATYARDYIIKVDGLQVAKYTTKDGSETSDANDIKTNNIAEKLFNQIEGETIVTETTTVLYDAARPTGEQYYAEMSQVVVTVAGGENVTQNNDINLPDMTSSGNLVFFREVDVNEGDSVTIAYISESSGSNLVVELNNNTIFISKADGSSFTIDTVDSADGNDLIAVQDYVSQLTNLPPYAPEGYVVKVQNQEGFDANSYWLKAETDVDGNDQSGSSIRWVETTSQKIPYRFDLDTMPHFLISESDGSFTLSHGEWKDRQVGDEDSNPFPSFVDSRIKSIGTFQNRILVTSGESAVFTRTNYFFDFFRETTQIDADSDPIDAYADADEINNLVHHAVLDGDIIFFAENGQFLISGNSPITKANIIFKKVTSYPVNVSAKPAVTGESVMFSFNTGKYTGIREMYTDSFTDTKRARPITEHVAEYIEGKAVNIITSPNINTMLLLTDKDDSVVYVYDWLWVGDQKVQSAIHKWTMSGDVLFAKFIEDEVYFVIKRDDGVYLESLPISSDEDDNGLDFPLRLDRRVTTTANYVNGRWEFSLPYGVSDTGVLEFVRGEGCWDADQGTSVIFETDGELYWSYDDLADTTAVTSCTLNAGIIFTSKYIPTRPYLKDQNGRAMGLDRFTLGKVTVNYESIGDTTVEVSDIRARRTWKYDYNGRMMGGWNNRVGFAPLDAGGFSFPVRLQAAYTNILVSTDDYRPFIIRDMEWEGMFKQRGRRI